VAVRQGEVGWRVITIIADDRLMTVKAIDDIATFLVLIKAHLQKRSAMAGELSISRRWNKDFSETRWI
jgi:hypothetical protein